MAYELKLPPDTERQIADFILNGFIGNAAQLAAANEIQLSLDKLKTNPKLGTSPPGPFESRPIYRFAVTVGSKAVPVQATYKVHERSKVVVILGFERIML